MVVDIESTKVTKEGIMFRLLFATLEPKILPNTVVILAAKKGDRYFFEREMKQ